MVDFDISVFEEAEFLAHGHVGHLFPGVHVNCKFSKDKGEVLPPGSEVGSFRDCAGWDCNWDVFVAEVDEGSCPTLLGDGFGFEVLFRF